MKTLSEFLIFLVLLLLFVIGCGEPQGGGAGYQYLGHLDSIKYDCYKDSSYTTTLRINDDTFTIIGKVSFKELDCIYVWWNKDKNTLRLRRREITFEHIISNQLRIEIKRELR